MQQNFVCACCCYSGGMFKLRIAGRPPSGGAAVRASGLPHGAAANGERGLQHPQAARQGAANGGQTAQRRQAALLRAALYFRGAGSVQDRSRFGAGLPARRAVFAVRRPLERVQPDRGMGRTIGRRAEQQRPRKSRPLLFLKPKTKLALRSTIDIGSTTVCCAPIRKGLRVQLCCADAALIRVRLWRRQGQGIHLCLNHKTSLALSTFLGSKGTKEGGKFWKCRTHFQMRY